MYEGESAFDSDYNCDILYSTRITREHEDRIEVIFELSDLAEGSE